MNKLEHKNKKVQKRKNVQHNDYRIHIENDKLAQNKLTCFVIPIVMYFIVYKYNEYMI